MIQMTTEKTDLEIAELRTEFRENMKRTDYVRYFGDDSIAIYGFEDDPLSQQYAAVAAGLLLQNRPTQHTINLAETDGNIRATDIKSEDRKVLVISHTMEDRYRDFVLRRFSDLENEGIIALRDVIYVTGKPYEHKKLSDLLPKVNSNSPKETLFSF
jgi:phospholipid N-methyltransferase